jgi:hypothetical protein
MKSINPPGTKKPRNKLTASWVKITLIWISLHNLPTRKINLLMQAMALQKVKILVLKG